MIQQAYRLVNHLKVHPVNHLAIQLYTLLASLVCYRQVCHLQSLLVAQVVNLRIDPLVILPENLV